MNNPLSDLTLDVIQHNKELEDDKKRISYQIILKHNNLPFRFASFVDDVPSKEALLEGIHELYKRVLVDSTTLKASKVCMEACFGTTIYTPEWDPIKGRWFVLKCDDRPIYSRENLSFFTVEGGYDCCEGWKNVEAKNGFRYLKASPPPKDGYYIIQFVREAVVEQELLAYLSKDLTIDETESYIKAWRWGKSPDDNLETFDPSDKLDIYWKHSDEKAIKKKST